MRSKLQLTAWAWLIVQCRNKLSRHLTQKRGRFIGDGETWPARGAQFRAGLTGALLCVVQLPLFARRQRLYQLPLRRVLRTSSLGLWIRQALTSVSLQVCYCQGESAASEAATHSLSRGSGFSLGSLLPLCTLWGKKRDTGWLRWDCLPDKKTCRRLNMH